MPLVLHRELLAISRKGGQLTVKGDILVEWDHRVERCATQEGDEVSAYGKEDEDDIDWTRQLVSMGLQATHCAKLEQRLVRGLISAQSERREHYGPKVQPNVALAVTKLSLRS